MRVVLFLCLCMLCMSGCRVVGDKSVSLLSPEEKALVAEHRRKKNEPIYQ